VNASRLLPWNRRYALRSYVSGSMWLVPLFALLVFMLFHRVVRAVGSWLVARGWADEATSFLALSTSGARALLETVVTMNLSFMVFTFGSLLVAIQVAGGQYTPRIIATMLLRDNAIRVIVGLFLFTLAFAARVIARIDATVNQFDVVVPTTLGVLSIMAFLYLIDYAARLLRPVTIVQRVGQSGVSVIQSVYPNPTTGTPSTVTAPAFAPPARVVFHEGTSGVVLAVDLVGLVTLARGAEGMIEFVPHVGDFIAVGEPLFRLHGGAEAIDDRRLRSSVALGSERTLEQDPTFAMRILVDIAIKALSAAINDPTTAVMAIDQLHRLLRLVGLRNLRNEELRDVSGAPRLIYITPNWEDYVHLTCTEIRHCGGASVQIVRRMRSMLENLLHSLPTHRHAELHRQLELLDRTIDGHFVLEEDRALARIADSQGLGGALGLPPSHSPGRREAEVPGRLG
jgi:uncharacterized membrane protein